MIILCARAKVTTSIVNFPIFDLVFLLRFGINEDKKVGTFADLSGFEKFAVYTRFSCNDFKQQRSDCSKSLEI